MQWVWQPFEKRHSNSIGAIFQAAVVRRMVINDVTGCNVWHFKGEAYGMIDNSNKMRSPYFMYAWAHKYLVGDLATWQSDTNRDYEVIPVTEKMA